MWSFDGQICGLFKAVFGQLMGRVVIGRRVMIGSRVVIGITDCGAHTAAGKQEKGNTSNTQELKAMATGAASVKTSCDCNRDHWEANQTRTSALALTILKL